MHLWFIDSMSHSCMSHSCSERCTKTKFGIMSKLTVYWTAVEQYDVKIPWDLEGTPLQIKTDSTQGSGEIIFVQMYNKDSNDIGYVIVYFLSTATQYYIRYCTGGSSYIDLPTQPPVDVDKIWTIAKTETALIITCNDVEVLNYLFTDSSDSRCFPTLGGDVVEQIKFILIGDLQLWLMQLWLKESISHRCMQLWLKESFSHRCIQLWLKEIERCTKTKFGIMSKLTVYWTAVEQYDVKIPWDLEGTPLQIKTDSTQGSGEIIFVQMYNKDSNGIGYVIVYFLSTATQYYIRYCTGGSSYIDLPTQPPVDVDKIWTIAKTETALIITCNDVEVLNYLFTDSSDSRCFPTLGGDVVEQIKFNSGDTASDKMFHWTAVEGGMDIPWDLEATPLQIKTNSTLGSVLDPLHPIFASRIIGSRPVHCIKSRARNKSTLFSSERAQMREFAR
eukprot:sb/3464690/